VIALVQWGTSARGSSSAARSRGPGDHRNSLSNEREKPGALAELGKLLECSVVMAASPPRPVGGLRVGGQHLSPSRRSPFRFAFVGAASAYLEASGLKAAAAGADGMGRYAGGFRCARNNWPGWLGPPARHAGRAYLGAWGKTFFWSDTNGNEGGGPPSRSSGANGAVDQVLGSRPGYGRLARRRGAAAAVRPVPKSLCGPGGAPRPSSTSGLQSSGLLAGPRFARGAPFWLSRADATATGGTAPAARAAR